MDLPRGQSQVSSSSLIVRKQGIKVILHQVNLPVAAVCELRIDLGLLGKNHLNLAIFRGGSLVVSITFAIWLVDSLILLILVIVIG